MKKGMENEMHKSVSEEVLAEIQEKHLTPRSKWCVLFHDYIVWTISVLALLLGGVSFGIFLTVLFKNDWDIYPQLGENSFQYGISVIPYLWVFLIVIFYFYAKYEFNKTDTGYRYEQVRIIVGSIAAGIILGCAVYFSGVAQDVDDYLVVNLPYYHKITGNHKELWSLPGQGLLAGTVATTTTDTFYLRDFYGHTWVVSYGKEIKKIRVTVLRGMKIKVIGEQTGSTTFLEKDIRPWVGEVEGVFHGAEQ